MPFTFVITGTINAFISRAIHPENGAEGFVKTTERSPMSRPAQDRFREMSLSSPHPNIGIFSGLIENGLYDILFITTTGPSMTTTLHDQVSCLNKVVPIPVILHVLWQLVSGVQHLQSHGFNHCELSPDTIVSDTSFNVVILDLGKARTQPECVSLHPDDIRRFDKQARFFGSGITDVYGIAENGLFMLRWRRNTKRMEDDAPRLYSLLREMQHHDPHKRTNFGDVQDDPLFAIFTPCPNASSAS